MFDCYIQCYPWDLLDEGLDVVLDRLQDQVGITGLTMVVICDRKEQFRPHLGVQPKIYRTSGGVYFRPDGSHYQATRLKPPIWEQYRKLDLLAKISQHCAERQLDLRLSLSPFHSQRLIAKHPQAACKNAYDVGSRHALCLNNADVQEYMLSLIRDLSVYDDVSAIEVDEVQWPEATDRHPQFDAARMFDAGVPKLLSICFCESCLQAAANANIDGQAALRSTRSLLDRCCQEGRKVDSPDVLRESAALARYVDWRASVILDLFGRVKRASKKSFVLHFHNVIQTPEELHGSAALLVLADRVIFGHRALKEFVDDNSQAASRSELLLRFGEGKIDDAPEAVRRISWAAEVGAGGVTVSHYGVVLENQFDWLHQGLRHARRL